MANSKTSTIETRNFQEVTVSTIVLPDGKIETIVFYNNVVELWQTNKVQDFEKQHAIGLAYASNCDFSYSLNGGPQLVNYHL